MVPETRTGSIYRRAINNAAVGMCLATPEGRIEEANAALCRFFGYDAGAMDGTYWQDYSAPEYLDEELDNVNAILDGRIDSYRMTKRYVHANGHSIWGELSVSAVSDERGKVLKIVGLITDITARVEADERNRRLARQLQKEIDQRAAQSVSYGVTAMEIGGHPDPLGAVHAQLAALWSIYPAIPEEVRMQLEIATAEIGANIIQHTGLGQPLRIRMNAALVDDQVHVSFTDNGSPADIDFTKVAMPDGMAESGRGLAMAEALLDQLVYLCDETGNHWTLISKSFSRS